MTERSSSRQLQISARLPSVEIDIATGFATQGTMFVGYVETLEENVYDQLSEFATAITGSTSIVLYKTGSNSRQFMAPHLWVDRTEPEMERHY